MKKNTRNRIFAGAAVFAFILAVAPAPAKADPRSYVWTYEYMTVREGRAELEYYSTTEIPNSGAPETSNWKHQVELEYGLTPKTDIALYQMFKQANTPTASTFRYDGMKLRLRHRLAEKGELPLDMLLYAEYVRGADLAEQGELEAKLVLAKDLGRLNLSYNQVVEFPVEKPSAAVHSFTAGASWKVSDILKAGLEAVGEYKAGGYYLGPTLHFRARDMKLWANLGYLTGLNPDSKDVQTRLIVGVPF